MVKLQVKVVSVSILFLVLIFAKSVKANFTSTNDEIDFRELIATNSQYPPMHEMCSLRILGGRTVDIEEVPYQILIVKCDRFCDFWNLVCGGSIITREHVLSAAHCFQIKAVRKYYRVVAGTGRLNMVWYQNLKRTGLTQSTSTEVWRKILSCFVHKHYNRKRHNHDFAVLKLDFPVNFSRAVRPIPMLKPSHGIEIKDDDKCLVTGFGLMERSIPSRHLRMACVPFITRTRCMDIYEKRFVTANQFCAGDSGKDSCEGDSGGPITYQGYLIGIVSNGGKCGQTPGIYTMISAYTSGDKIPLAMSHCVMLSLNILRIVFLVFLISVHNFVVIKHFTL